MTVALETARLRLRPLCHEDLDALHELYGDPEIMRFITGEPRSLAKTRERLAEHIDDHRRFGFGLYATELKTTGKMIGRCGLLPAESAIGLEGELAWMFKKSCWGRGLGTEIGLALLDFGLERPGVARIWAKAHRENHRSIAIMKRLGMRLTRTTDRAVFYEASPRDPRPAVDRGT